MSGFRTFQSGSSIYYFEEFEMGGTSGTVICKDVLDDVITEIEHNNTPMIEQKLDLLYNELQAFASDVKRVNLNINYLMFQLIHIASEISKDVDQDEILQKINKNAFTDGTIRGSRMHLKRFATEYAEYLVQLRENLSGGILPQIEKEIREHYMDNLTLKELSKKYFINNVYLGQIFKKKYEISFKDYLNNVRVEKAAHLLLCTDKKVYEIADDVGYGNLDYFINRFIALKGCTPARFRKQER